jgi:hypothetical protein
VRVDSADSDALGRTFRLITKEDDGKLWRNSYSFDGVRVRLSGKEEYHAGASDTGKKVGVLNVNQLQAKLPEQGWFRRQWNALKRKMGAKN